MLYQIYDRDDAANQSKVKEYRKAFRKAIHLMEGIDAEVMLQVPGEPLGPAGQELLADLYSAAGHFRGVAVALRATV